MSFLVIEGPPLGNEFNEYSLYLADKLDQASEEGAQLFYQFVYELTPEKTGELRESITIEEVGPMEYAVGSDNPVFVYLDEGTTEHWVEPVQALALHWIDEETGEDRFSKGHMVSGIEPMHITENAWEMAEPLIDELMNRAETEAWNETSV